MLNRICKNAPVSARSLQVCDTGLSHRAKSSDSTTETIQSPALPLESVDDVHGSDSLPLGMLSVGDGVADDILQEHLHT